MELPRRTRVLYGRSFGRQGHWTALSSSSTLANDPAIERIAILDSLTAPPNIWPVKRHAPSWLLWRIWPTTAEALREVSAPSEVPGRRGYPGYLYTNLSTPLRTCRTALVGKRVVTQFGSGPCQKMTSPTPSPDLTGSITEGQIILSRDLYNSGLPLTDYVLHPFLVWRTWFLVKATREDHATMNQLFAAYAH